MPKWDTVAIVGVGLIGGSIGLALQQRRLARNVVGIGRRASSLRSARRCGAVTSTTTNLQRGVSGSEVVIVCTPVGSIVQQVQAAAMHCPDGALITDAGSTKAGIVAALPEKFPRGVTYVGSHPLAGSEKNGPQYALPDLFDGRVVVVTPTRRTPESSLREVERFWAAIGGRVVSMTPQAHDEALAGSSHLPHLIASALAVATSRKHLPLVAGGWLDTTRVAAGDPQLWEQILLENRGPVLKALEKFDTVLASFRNALSDANAGRIRQLLKSGKDIRDSVGS